MGIIGSLRNAVLHRPIHSVLIIAAGGYIHKHASLGVAVGLHKDDLDGMGSANILKGVGLHRADALAVDLDVGDGIALIWGDGKGLIPTLTDADAAGGRDGTASTGSCLDGVVAVVPTAATAGLVIQLNLAGQGRVVVIIRREAPFVGRVGLDRGIVGQGLALVIHPFQLAITGIQSASLGGQRRVLQRLAAGGDLGVVRLAGRRGRFDHEHEGSAGDVVVVVVARLSRDDADRADLDGSQNAGFGIDGRLAGARVCVDAVGHCARAGAASGGQCQCLTVDHTTRTGDGQRLLIVLFCQSDVQRDGEILVIVTGRLEGDGDLVTRLAAGDGIGQQDAVRCEVLLGQDDARLAAERPVLPGGQSGPVRRVGVIRGVRVLLLQLDRFEVAAICLVHRDFKFNVLHCVVVFGVLRSELCLEGLGGSRSAAHRFAAIHPTPAVRQRHIRQRLTVFCRQPGGNSVGRRCLSYHKFAIHSFKSVVVIRITNAGVHTVGTGVQRGRILNIPRLNGAAASSGITVGHLSIQIARPVCQGRCAGRFTVSIARHAELAVLLSLFDSDIRSSRNR